MRGAGREKEFEAAAGFTRPTAVKKRPVWRGRVQQSDVKFEAIVVGFGAHAEVEAGGSSRGANVERNGIGEAIDSIASRGKNMIEPHGGINGDKPVRGVPRQF